MFRTRRAVRVHIRAAHFMVLAVQNEVQEDQDGNVGRRTHVEEPAMDGVLKKCPQHKPHSKQRQNQCRCHSQF